MKKAVCRGKYLQNMLRSSLHDAAVLEIFLLIHANFKSLTNHFHDSHFLNLFRFECLSIQAVTQ